MVDFEWQIRRSVRRKTLALCVYPDNRVVAAAPAKLSKSEIINFVETKSDWIRKRLQLNREKQGKSPAREFKPGENLWYLGRKHGLEVCERRTVGVSCAQGKITVFVRPEMTAETRSGFIRREIITWYGNMAQKKIAERVRYFTGIIGAIPRAVKIKTLKSRWGSCSAKGDLNFAWNIIMAPGPVLDYLVVHELCHLIHHDHSDQYWRLVEKSLPEHRERRKWLRQNGYKLKL
jgi:hypothetical protein